MLALRLDAGSIEGRCACSRSAPTPTTSRSAAAARCCGSPRRDPDAEVTWVVLSGDGERAEEARRERRGLRGRLRVVARRRRGLPRRLLPVRRRRGQGLLRAPEGRGLARRRLHAPAVRPPPGPPARLRADVEHLPRPPGPRVRDPEVRRRPRRAEPVRAARASRSPRGRSSAPHALRDQRDQRWFTRDLFARRSACGAWSRTRRPATPRRSTAGSSSSLCPASVIDGVRSSRWTDPGRARDDPTHAPGGRPALPRLRRDLLHERLRGVVKGWHSHREMTLNYACVSGGSSSCSSTTGRARRPRRRAGGLPRARRLLARRDPAGIWSGFKGMSEPYALVANCCTHAHDPSGRRGSTRSRTTSRTTGTSGIDDDVLSARQARPSATSCTSSSPTSTRSAGASPATASARRSAASRERVPLEVHEVPTGTEAFDWTVPQEWNIRDAYVTDRDGQAGRRLRGSNLHVVGYSIPVDARMPLAELREHLSLDPGAARLDPLPDLVLPRGLGVLPQPRRLLGLEDGDYDVVIDSTLEDGHLTYGEYFLAGRDGRTRC